MYHQGHWVIGYRQMKARQRKQGRVEEGWFLVALLQLPLAPGVSPTFSAPGQFVSAPVSEKIGKEFTGTRKEIFRTLRFAQAAATGILKFVVLLLMPKKE